MRGICIPCYELLADVIPEAEKLRERSKFEKIKIWKKIIFKDVMLINGRKCPKNKNVYETMKL